MIKFLAPTLVSGVVQSKILRAGYLAKALYQSLFTRRLKPAAMNATSYISVHCRLL